MRKAYIAMELRLKPRFMCVSIRCHELGINKYLPERQVPELINLQKFKIQLLCDDFCGQVRRNG
ncbi:MAG: hypothetical protein DBP01_04135 [gamma proteobacterium symbiont of Ctena orbiculata]|nr:MAG: hypothetical protein DBP01_04135 [gamma proteobacterium symbiont of Ctena orbiculata]